jgi:TolB-like protein/DNA-binding winged helix-turn-helix (wHTH) protein/Tfp pilus assembly protein PilF
MSESSKEIYEFLQFRLEVSERRLIRKGRVVRLPDKAFDTLCVLVRRHGQLVTKEELMSSVWPETIVEENNLDQKISALRGVLGEGGKGKEKFIETVRGHGYRFLAEVEVIRDVPSTRDRKVEAPASAPTRFDSGGEHYSIETRRQGNVVAVASWQRPEPDIPPEPVEGIQKEREVPAAARPIDPRNEPAVSQGQSRLLQISLLTVVVLGLFFLTWTALLSSSSETSSGEAAIESLAVMPFMNETGNPDNDFLSDGLTESLIGSLSQIPGLSVKARNSVFRYKGQEIDATNIGRELSVGGVLLGRFTQHRDNLILGLELVDARTGNVIWAEHYDRKGSEIVSLQREIAADVSRKLRARLSKADQDRVTKVHTADPEANRLYLQGMYHLNKRTAEDIRRSIALFEQAAAEDPTYAKAFAGVAMSYLILPDYNHGLSRDEVKLYDQAFRAAVQKAYALDSDLTETVLLSAAVKDVDWDVEGAVREYERAIELDPNFATPRHWYSRFLGALGKHDEALSQIYKAQELDPQSRSIAFNVGGRLADARRFDEAIKQYKQVLQMEPDHPLTHFALASAYDANAMYAEAIGEHQIADVLLEKESTAGAERKAQELRRALESGGAEAYWRKRLEYSRRDQAKGVGSTYRIAVCLARLGETENAIDLLERSVITREPDAFWVRTESAFDILTTYPRFIDLMRRLGVGG